MQLVAFVLYFCAFYLAVESTAIKYRTRLRIVHVLAPMQKNQATVSFSSRTVRKLRSKKQPFSVALSTADFLDVIERSIHTGHSLRAAVNDALLSYKASLNALPVLAVKLCTAFISSTLKLVHMKLPENAILIS